MAAGPEEEGVAAGTAVERGWEGSVAVATAEEQKVGQVACTEVGGA